MGGAGDAVLGKAEPGREEARGEDDSIVAAASVPCPQISSSVVGVNQRRRRDRPSPATKAVAGIRNSAATDCIHAVSGISRAMQTAAGLPWNGSRVNVSTWKSTLMRML